MNEKDLAEARIGLLRHAIERVTGTPEKPEGNQTEFGRRLGYKDGAFVRQMLAGGKPITEKTIRKIEAMPGMERWFTFMPELESAAAPSATRHKSASSDLPVTGQPTDLIKRLLPDDKGNVVTWERPEDLEPDEDRVWIDRYDYRFSAGEGLIQWEVRQKKALPFDRGFFRALGSNPKDCKLLVVRGDSMEPFLFNRDMFMVDTAKTRIHDGGIYAVYFEDEALVKQIFKKPGGALTLHSYNMVKFPDREISASELEYVKVVGELIYRSGSGPAGGN